MVLVLFVTLSHFRKKNTFAEHESGLRYAHKNDGLFRARLKGNVACNTEVFWGRATDIAATLDFKRRGRLGRVERATKGEGISLSRPLPGPLQHANPTWRLRLTEILTLARP